MSATIEKSDARTSTLIIKGHENYQSLQILASTPAMRALKEYANKKFDSLSAEDRAKAIPFSGNAEAQQTASGDFIARQAKEFFEAAKLPYAAHEVAHDKSIKRSYGFEKDGSYQSHKLDLPSNNIIKSFFKPFGVNARKGSFGFMKALHDELNDDIMYNRVLNEVVSKNEVTLHPDNAHRADFGLPDVEADVDRVQEFLDRKGIKQENDKETPKIDGPGF